VTTWTHEKPSRAEAVSDTTSSTVVNTLPSLPRA
jgi:hypothetical protein